MLPYFMKLLFAKRYLEGYHERWDLISNEKKRKNSIGLKKYLLYELDKILYLILLDFLSYSRESEFCTVPLRFLKFLSLEKTHFHSGKQKYAAARFDIDTVQNSDSLLYLSNSSYNQTQTNLNDRKFCT